MAKRKRIEMSEPLRPLAHLTIKDQTIATAMMMCMADAVETAQGPTSGSKSVSSFGNRLFCSWIKDQARFGWGSSTTYSKYFKDYQGFLKRTAGSAEMYEILSVFSPSPRAIYEVHLDMSTFYDSIDRETLLIKLRAVVDGYHGIHPDQSEGFWQAVDQCFKSWRWNSKDLKLNSCLKADLKNDGLPQGLVASGFFANVYLLDFDSACRELINSTQSGFVIHDYCRYVDDLRLVISVNKEADRAMLESVKQSIVSMLGLLLPPRELKFNLEKTKMIRWSEETCDVTSQMGRLQTMASGPMDIDSLIHVENSLDSLFLRAETAQDENTDLIETTCPLPLASIRQVTLGVREDTVLRFAANRWAKVFKSRRRLADSNSLKSLDATQEAVARRFVESWAKNPALTLLLKKGLQLYPSPELLDPVWTQLVAKISDGSPLRERCIASYCLAEICRFSVTDLQKVSRAELPQHIEIADYYNYLHVQVHKLIEIPDIPWYLKQQAGLLLVGQLSLNETAIFKEDELLAQVMSITNGRASGNPSVVIPAALVAWQIAKDALQVLASLSVWLSKLGAKDRSQALEAIAVNNPDLFIELINYFEHNNSALREIAQPIRESLGFAAPSIPDEIGNWKGAYSLGAAILSEANPFIHENSLIKLALAVTDTLLAGKNLILSPQSLSVSCVDWNSIQNPGVVPIEIIPSIMRQGKNTDMRYAAPSWLKEEGNAHQLYGLGCLLRACAVGSCDFTAPQMLFRQDVSDFYSGLKSSWYKRRMGMMHSPEALAGEAAPMSGWVTELLFNLLQWPGLDIEDWEEQWPSDLSLTSLKPILERRLEHQRELYGMASDTPLYVQRINLPAENGNVLRVVTVQSLLPKKNDFKEYGTELDDKNYREKHRGHLTDLCNLVLKKLSAMEFANDNGVKSPANLIVFPELSVHKDDVDLLEALSAKTKAMVFAGIVFHQHEGKLINRALWLIPYHTNQGGLRWVKRWQGKWNMTTDESGISPWRPYQLIIELKGTLPHVERGFRMSGAICYDATDMRLTADLRDHSDAFLIAAMNRDITTFDSMIDALHYHMFQHVILVNTGEFGGSAAKAPFKLPHHRTIAHTHGNEQIAITVFEIDM
ncbi:MAG: RNA-directed DNA polymerase, partial [Candidatus Obscuribacterales bacterium]|nr:RNA-directed DNA polymerase [Candidatus Obscuribacterales bacterium]